MIGKAPSHGTKLTKWCCACLHLLCGKLWGGWPMCGWMVKLSYLSLSDGVSWKKSSQMCGSLYFPKFLLTEGSLTCMYISSFMFLVTPCVYLSTMVKHSGLTGYPVKWLWWCIGDGVLRYSLSLSPKVLPDSPRYSLWIVHVWAYKSIYNITFFQDYCPCPWQPWHEF